jgi:hypothetical protein
MTPYVIIPRSELDKLEAARVALWEFVDKHYGVWEISSIQRTTSVIWELVHRNWPAYVYSADDYWALWPDGYMVSWDELDAEIRNGRSDDVEKVIVVEYDEDGTPSKWMPA